MIENNLKELQQRLDDLPYPPTLLYKLDGFVPDEFLRKRLETIEKVAPKFFNGKNFLDIGFCKGFFSFLASKNCKQCVGIEPDKKYFDLCQDIKEELNINNLEFINSDFKDFKSNILFDKVFIGNCMHYLYHQRTSDKKAGWIWLYKLAAMIKTNGILVIEAPLDGNENRDIAYLKEDKEYTKDFFLKLMSQFFELIDITESTSKFRYVISFKRKQNEIENIYNYEELKKVKSLDNRDDRQCFTTQHGFVCKVPDERIILTTKEIIKIVASSYLPTRAKILGLVKHEDQIIGVAQEFIYPKGIHKTTWDIYQEDQENLIKMGYCEIDPAVVNILPTGKVDQLFSIVDFDGVYYIDELTDYLVKVNQGNILRNYSNFIYMGDLNKQIKLIQEIHKK